MNLQIPDDCTKDIPLLVCVSGGADSVCLLLSLIENGYTCIAAHCNFHLRGAESDQDERFVSDLTSRLGIPLVTTDFDTTSYASEKHISIEMAARELRYAWFEEERIRHGCRYIAVAHNLNDSVETFFLNLTRGTGIRGLTGISPVNGNIIRPLLNTTRLEIEEFLSAHNQPFRTDSTNNDTHYRRNLIRHNILPEFISMNPSFLISMRDTMENLASAHAALSSPSSPNSRLYELYSTLNPYGFSHDLIRQIWQAELSGKSGQFFSYNDVKVVINRGKACIYEGVTVKDEGLRVNDDGLRAEGQGLRITIVPRETPLKSTKNTAFFDADKLHLPLSLRHWVPGDWFIPFGMKGRKKISDFLTDLKLDLVQKENQLLVVDADDNVVWVVGHRTDNRFAVENKSLRVAKVTFEEKC